LGASTRLSLAFRLDGSRGCLVVKYAQEITGVYNSTLLHGMALQHTISWGRHFQDNLVRFQVHQVFITTDVFTRLLVPSGHCGIFHALG
jgi:hypothetical protein